MVSNKVKRNIWLTLAILSIIGIVDRIIKFIDGSIEWWSLVSAVIITILCTRFYLSYRRQVREGNLFGKVDPLNKES